MPNYICTITPNPALDLGGLVEKVIPNEKSYVYDETKYPGGNGINVSRILTRLKIPNMATGFLGGSIGREIRDLLDKEKVPNKFVEIKGQSRISLTVSNKEDHRQTRLSFVGPLVISSEKEKIFKIIKKSKGICLVVIGGSVPRGFSGKDIVQIIKIANLRKINTIVDCPGALLKQVISARPMLIKPNLAEFQELVGKNVKTINGVLAEAKKLLNRVPLICVSSVEGGALLITKSQAFFGRIPQEKIKSTVGAGDSMVGAMAAQIYLKNTAPDHLLRWGLAASAATLIRPGTSLGKKSDIVRFYNRVKIHQVYGPGSKSPLF